MLDLVFDSSRAPIFECWMVGCEFKNKHKKICIEKILDYVLKFVNNIKLFNIITYIHIHILGGIYILRESSL